MVATGRPSESKQGLVVTLVFFILSTIGLGVTTYYGMAEQDKLKKTADDEKKRVGVANDERDWFRWQAGFYRTYLGAPAAPETPIGRDVALNKSKFDAGNFGQDPTTKKEYADLPDVRALVAKLAARAPWDATKAMPTADYEGIVKLRDDRIKDLTDKLTEAEKQRLAAQAKVTKAQADLATAQGDFKAANEKVKKDWEIDRNDYAEKIGKLEKILKEAENKKDPIYQELVDAKLRLEKEKQLLEKKLKDFEARVVVLQTQADAKIDDKPLKLIPRGEIVRVAGNLRRATINIGRGKNLKAGTTFAVYGLTGGGKPKARSKGNVEVLAVGDRTSEVAITAIFDPEDPGDRATGRRREINLLSRSNTDPIVRGDVLINPLWDPNAQTHVAIAGVIDFSSTGTLSMTSFIRLLEKQNIVVDAYLDPADGVAKGPGINRRTDYLILGSTPTGREAGVSRDNAVLKQMEAVTKKLLDEAKANAVKLINPRRFLQDTGLTIPRIVSRD